MDNIKQYLMSVFIAALIGAIVVRISGKSTLSSGIIKLIVAVFISLTVIVPVMRFEIQDFSGYMAAYDDEAQRIVSEVRSTVMQETAEVIIQRTQTYIEDKAALYGATITAMVTITDTETLIPDSVSISGNISNYGKISLKKIIQDDLGIPEDRQTWN